MTSDDAMEHPDFAELYDGNFSKVYNYVRYRVLDPAAADDVTSRVFEKALDGLAGFDAQKGPVSAWLFGIAKNAVSDHFRADRWRSWLPLDAFFESRSEEPRNEDALIEDESKKELFDALERLDERERELLALKFGAGMTNRAIAAQTGLTESNVGVIVYRAVKKLQSLMKGTP